MNTLVVFHSRSGHAWVVHDDEVMVEIVMLLDPKAWP